MICLAPGTPLVSENVELPEPGPDQVLIETAASGVCHSDLAFASGSMGMPFPMILGHEATGRVVEVGSDVASCQPGDKVIVSILPVCGVCWHCVRSETQHCEQQPRIHTSSYVLRQDGSHATAMAGLGSFAQMMRVNEMSVVKIDSDLPPEQLAMIGCGVTTGVGAVLWTAGVEPGSDVAVFGCGGVGQAVIQGARLAGAGRIFAIDPAPLKRTMSLSFGATEAIDPTNIDPIEYLRQMTGGRGVDYAFEVTGLPRVTAQAYASIRKRGTTVVVGMPPAGAEVSVPGRSLFFEEKRLIGSLYGSAQVRHHLAQLIRFAETGRLDLAPMVSRRIALEDVNDAFDAMQDGSAIRSVILF
jgi:S-(hydroxymethyl)glutathione dehydrogenase/alcohol dehydrogenase